MLTIIAATEYELAGLRRAWPAAGDEVELQGVGIGKQAAPGDGNVLPPGQQSEGGIVPL